MIKIVGEKEVGMYNIKINYQTLYKITLKTYVFTQILFTTTYNGFGSLNKYDIRNIVYILVSAFQLFLLFLYFKMKKRKYEVVVTSIVGIVLTTIFIIDGFKLNFIILILFILLGTRVNLDEIYKELQKVVGFMLLFVVFGSFIGIFENVSLQRGNEVRYSFGYVTPNAFGAVVLEYWLLRLLNTKKLLTIKNFIIFFLMFYMTFSLANSRTAAILMSASIFFYLYFKYLEIIPLKPILKWGIRLTVVLIPIFVLFISSIFNLANGNHRLIDKLVSGRLYYSNLFLAEYNLTLFGTDLKILTRDEALRMGQAYKFLDCAYIYIAIEYGIILLLILMFGIYILLKRQMNMKKYDEVICVLIFVIYGIFELGFFSIEINFTLLMLACLFHRKIDPRMGNVIGIEEETL